MGIVSGLYRTGKFALTNPVGRVMTGAAIGGAAGLMSGDEFSSGNSIINRAIVGGMFGGAIGAGITPRGIFRGGVTAGRIGLKTGIGMGRAGLKVGAMPGMITAGLATAGIGGGIMGYEALAKRSRQQRFQESTVGLVNGMHQGRHRG